MEQGLIFDFHRGTTHDGPGMRTTVFFKGCPLHCEWCHNPESITPNIELQWDERKCIGCLQCVNQCKRNVIQQKNGKIVIKRNECQKCYCCVDNCPSKALSTVGTYWGVDDLVTEVCKDKMFFGDFEGGVTVSGGEAMLQYDFLQIFLKKLKAENVNIALDTSGFGKRDVFEKIYPYVDVFLFDIKFLDEISHKKFTGVDNKLILSNIKNIAHHVRKDQGKQLWIRTPLIPEATATKKNIEKIGEFIKKELIDVIDRWELCAFNNVCKDKYKKLNQEWKYQKHELMEEKLVNELASVAKGYVGNLLVVSGLTKK